jgi:hypothetical protein
VTLVVKKNPKPPPPKPRLEALVFGEIGVLIKRIENSFYLHLVYALSYFLWFKSSGFMPARIRLVRLRGGYVTAIPDFLKPFDWNARSLDKLFPCPQPLIKVATAVVFRRR